MLDLDDTIRYIIQQEIKKQGLIRIKRGVVSAVSGSNVTVKFPLDDTPQTDIYDKTNQSITVGNNVMVVYPNDSDTESFIGWKV